MNYYFATFFVLSPILPAIHMIALLYSSKKNKVKLNLTYCIFYAAHSYFCSTGFMIFCKAFGVQRGYYGWGHFFFQVLIIAFYTIRALHRRQKKKNTAKTDDDTPSDTNRNWLKKEEVEAFVDKNADYYLGVWKSHYYTFYKGLNAPAVFLGISWMAYRKMYLSAVLMSFVQIVGFRVILMYNFDAAIVLLYAIHALIGYLGNAIYRKKALRLLKKTVNLDETERRLVLSEKGGVNTFAFVICFAVNLVSVVSGIVLHLSG